MGKPVKIVDLAKQMLSLSGLTLKTESNPYGDIEIIYSGLRPGEKIYEELLLEKKSKKTKNPLIFEALEKPIDYKNFWDKFNEFEKSIYRKDKKLILRNLSLLVSEWDLSNSIKELIN